MSINICKECGKQFEASSARVQYCPDIHYRPCPICGKPVVAKYLSDPARRCDECKNKGKMAPVARVEILNPAVTEIREESAEVSASSGYTYAGPEILGFKTGHSYLLDIQWDSLSAYKVIAKFDFTEDAEVDLMILLSSKASLKQYFGYVQEA